jgi:hypothetical protein
MTQAPRTLFASAALRIAGMLAAEAHQIRLGREIVRKLKVLEPDGPSTHGGKLARLSIVLAPEQGDGQSLMCGWLDVGAEQAELRTFEALSAHHASRFGRPIDIEAGEYAGLLETVKAFLEKENFKVALSAEAPRPPTQEVAAPSGGAADGPRTVMEPAPAGAAESRFNGFVLGVAAASFVLGAIVGGVVASLAGG